jgi:hypothetical protein
MSNDFCLSVCLVLWEYGVFLVVIELVERGYLMGLVFHAHGGKRKVQ